MISSLISEVSSLTEEVEKLKQKNVRIHIHTQTYNFRGKFRKFSLCSDDLTRLMSPLLPLILIKIT